MLIPKFIWRKLASAKWADAWVERLRGLDPARLVLVEKMGARALRLEFYCLSQREGRTLIKRFGGSLHPLRAETWQPRADAAPPRPLAFGSRLLITGHEKQLEPLRAQHPRKWVLCVPAALAFGSGEHATTAMCLRLLDGIARCRSGTAWEMLDLGTGSGILALAARALGARRVEGMDYDPPCVRTARANVRLNELRGVSFAELDVQRWKPARTWDVVAANLFANLLETQMPKFARALASGGDLLLSGLLAEQLPEVEAAADRAGLAIVAVKARGRWRALHLRAAARPARKRRPAAAS